MFLSAALILASGIAEAKDGSGSSSEMEIPCAALFGIMAQMYEGVGDTGDAEQYRARLIRLTTAIKTSYEEAGDPVKDAERDIARHFEELVDALEKRDASFRRMRTICDDRFP